MVCMYIVVCSSKDSISCHRFPLERVELLSVVVVGVVAFEFVFKVSDLVFGSNTTKLLPLYTAQKGCDPCEDKVSISSRKATFRFFPRFWKIGKLNALTRIRQLAFRVPRLPVAVL